MKFIYRPDRIPVPIISYLYDRDAEVTESQTQNGGLHRHGEKTMRCGAIILGCEGRPVYQNPLGHTSMPSIRIISMSTAARFICCVQRRGPYAVQFEVRLIGTATCFQRLYLIERSRVFSRILRERNFDRPWKKETRASQIQEPNEYGNKQVSELRQFQLLIGDFHYSGKKESNNRKKKLKAIPPRRRVNRDSVLNRLM